MTSSIASRRIAIFLPYSRPTFNLDSSVDRLFSSIKDVEIANVPFMALRRHPCRAQPGQRLGLFVPFHCAQAQWKLRHSAYPAAAPAAHSGASNSAAQSVDLHQPRHRPQALNGHEAAHGQTTLRCKTPEAAVGINLPQSLQLLRDRFALCLHRFVRRGHQVSGTNHQQGSAQPAAASSNNADSTRRGSKRSSSKPSGS